MSKSFQGYGEELPDETTKYHMVRRPGDVYLTNFKVDKDQLLPQHIAVIDNLILPFIIRAIKRLGPGTYALHVLGSASATGLAKDNLDLSKRRAENAAEETVYRFGVKQEHDESLQGAVLIPAPPEAIGDTLSKPAAKLLHLDTKAKIEKNQSFFRSVLFKFKAGLEHPSSAAIFSIRDIFIFKFKTIEEPMPKVLRDIERVLNNPVIKFFMGKAIDRVLKPFFTAIGPSATIIQHLVKFVIPHKADYCFEVKDYRNQHALYRYSAIEHSDKLGIVELLSFISKLHGILKVLHKVAKTVESVSKNLETFEKMTEQEIDKALDKMQVVIGDVIADQIKKFIGELKSGNLLSTLSVSSSKWANFKFHDQSPNHNVEKLSGPAKRHAVDFAMYSVVDLDFGGPVPNNWTAYNASAHFKSGFSLKSGIYGVAPSLGSFILLKGPFGGDFPIGPSNVVTD